MAPDSQKAAGEAAFCVRPCREGGCFSKAQGTAASARRSHLKPFSNPPATGTQSPERVHLRTERFLEADLTMVTLPPVMNRPPLGSGAAPCASGRGAKRCVREARAGWTRTGDRRIMSLTALVRHDDCPELIGDL